MRRIRAVVYGAGAMGALATRLMTEKDVEIVGAIARNPSKVGRDLGEFAGIGHIGVPIEADAEHVLATHRPDVVLHATQSFLPEIQEQLALCVRHGANVVTISEESFYPWSSSPAIAAELDALAKQHGATITGSGHQDSFWLHQVSALLGTAHRIDSVYGKATWNADEYGAEIIQSKHVGETLEQFQESIASEHRPPTFGGNLLAALAQATGLTPKEWKTEISPVVAEEDRHSNSIGTTFSKGTVIGYSDIDVMHTVEGPTFTFEMSGYIFGAGESDMNQWVIKGEPDLFLDNGVVPSYTTTCTQWVNRIPDVINAPAGFVTPDQLPPLRYRSMPMHSYVTPGRLA
ncbi:dihydrodipicolinate reductase [Streptomyces sp. NPDC059373]